MPSATLQQFAHTNDAAAATTKKLQKYAILADYFRTLDDDDLRLAVRYAAGRAFAATDERVLNVGWALASDVLLSMLPLDPREFHDLVVRHGELGEALRHAWPAPRGDVHESAPALLLTDLAAAFDDLAGTGDRERKRELLRQLYARCRAPEEAAYLAKIIFGDMRTGVQEGVLEQAIARAFEREGPAVQRCQLLVGDLGEVAVLAKHDACAAAQLRLFHPIQFMLATAQDTPQEAAGTIGERTFWAEDKLDGIRAQVHKSADGASSRVAIYTRTMDRCDASFPEVVAAMARLPGEFLLDGEIVPWRDGAVLPFAHIQRRLGRKTVSAKMLRENPCAFIAFDILSRDGALLMDRPLRERREALAQLATCSTGFQPVAVSPASMSPVAGHRLEACATRSLLIATTTEVASAAQIESAFAAARERRNEGIVLKDPRSPYSPGRRGQAWLKLKTHLPTLDCVVVAAETGHGKRRNSLSDYTFAVWDRDPADPDAKLVTVGKAYIGVTDEEIARLTETFTTLTVQQFGRVRAVKPQVVLEIAADQIQKSRRHASGFALRFPRIKRIRWDKRPEDADRLERVAELYASEANFGRREVADEPPAEPTLFDAIEQ